MILFHGTTRRRAERICREGFLPRKPSRRVWFAQGRGYAQGRAKTQARRGHDKPVVLVCDVDLAAMRKRLGPKRFMHQGGVIAIAAPVPVSVVRSRPGSVVPTTPEELAAWLCDVLGLKPYKGPGTRHPGVRRLAEWVSKRYAQRPNGEIAPASLLRTARRWLPEYFEGMEVDFDHLSAWRRTATVQMVAHTPEVPGDTRAEAALEMLTEEHPRRRAKGLRTLADAADPDLFDWCVMFLEDDAPSVQLAALESMLHCEVADTDVIAPLAESPDKRVRAAAIAALAHHGGAQARAWLERGLKDPEACVRVHTVAQLEHADPAMHRDLFELALYDPNRDVVRVARKLTAGRNYAKRRW